MKAHPALMPIATTVMLGIWRAAAGADGITEYQAIYDVSYGNFSGTGKFGVTTNDNGEYIFATSIKIKGLVARALLGKDPALEGSRFVVSAGHISPLRFWYEDGTRKGDNNFVISFDAPAGEIQILGPEVSRTLPYEKDLLDRGSLQVALMRDLRVCKLPGPYRYVDDDGVTSYEYEQLEDGTTETGIGMLDTVRLLQHHEGSGHTTVLWLAPEYAYVPVRIERFDDGELEWTFALDELDGIEREDVSCSGFR